MTDPPKMTLYQRYENIRELSEVFKHKGVLRNLILKHLQEAIDEARKEGARKSGNPFAGNPLEWFCSDCRQISEALSHHAYQEGFEQARDIASNLLVQEKHRALAAWSLLCEFANQIRALQPPREIYGVEIKTDPTLKRGEWRIEKKIVHRISKDVANLCDGKPVTSYSYDWKLVTCKQCLEGRPREGAE